VGTDPCGASFIDRSLGQVLQSSAAAGSPGTQVEKEHEMANEKQTGIFLESLKRNNTKIREDRATAIVEDAQIIYKREVEDLAMQLKRLHREQDNMLDLSPTDADSLVLASDFDAKDYVSKDLEISVKIRNLEIKYELAKGRYAYLFGDTGSL
jgi:CRISPR/Cas system CMR subunit Cmr4 (Cas7 group RAMP superfamily)